MEIARPRLRETAISPKFTTNLRWYRLMLRVCALLGGRKCRKCVEKLYIDLRRTLQAGTGFKDYLVKWFSDHLEFLTRNVRRDLSVAKKESRKRILFVYHEQSQTFIRTLQFFKMIEKTIGLNYIDSEVSNICCDFWINMVIKSNVLLPRMAKVLTQRILDRNVDSKQSDYVNVILQSLPLMGGGVELKFLHELEICLEEQLRETMLKLLQESLTKSSCAESLTKIAQWEGNIREAIRTMKLSAKFRLSTMEIFTVIADVFFGKAAEEVNPKYKQFAAENVGRHMPIRATTTEEYIDEIWTPMFSDPYRLPEELLEMKTYFVCIGIFCGAQLSWPKIWMPQVLARIRSEIITFPTDPALRITDSRAYIDFYFDSWTSHCKYISYYSVLARSILKDYTYISFLNDGFGVWGKDVVDVERGNLYSHLLTLLQQCLTNPEVEVDHKLVHAIYSFRFLRTKDREEFQNYFLRHLMMPYTDKMTKEIEEKLKIPALQGPCVTEVMLQLDRVARVCSRLPLSKAATGVFNKRVGKVLFRFLCSTFRPHVMKGNFKFINDVGFWADPADKPAMEQFYSKVSTLCEELGRRELSTERESLGKMQGLFRLAGSLLATSFQLDTHLMQPLMDKLKSAMMKGFRSAVNQEAASRGFSTLSLITEVLLPSMGVLPLPSIEANDAIRRMLHVARTFKYVCHADGFSRLFLESLATRILSARDYLCLAEFYLYRLVYKNLDVEHQKKYWQQIVDLTLSQKRMQCFPLVYGFGRMGYVPYAETDEENIQMAAQALRPYVDRGGQPHGGPDDTVIFEGIEFSIRVLRDEAWPISNKNDAFTPPPILQRIMDNFTTIYHKVDGEARKLTWIHHATGITMLWKFTPDQRVYEVRCDSFVAAIMLMFEDLDEIAFEVIKQKMNMSDTALRMHLSRLLKINVLVCKTNSHTEETLALNPDFQWETAAIVIKDETEKLHELDNASRQQQHEKSGRDKNCAQVLQAAIMRVAKRNQTISRKELLQQTIWELRTLTCETPSLLMNALDHLVQQSYLIYDTSSRLFIYMP